MLLKEQWIDVGSQMQTMLKKVEDDHKGVLAVRATCISICIGYTSIIYNKVFWSVINTVEILDLVLNCQIYLNQTKPNPTPAYWLVETWESIVGFTSLCFDPLKSDGHVSFYFFSGSTHNLSKKRKGTILEKIWCFAPYKYAVWAASQLPVTTINCNIYQSWFYYMLNVDILCNWHNFGLVIFVISRISYEILNGIRYYCYVSFS